MPPSYSHQISATGPSGYLWEVPQLHYLWLLGCSVSSSRSSSACKAKQSEQREMSCRASTSQCSAPAPKTWCCRDLQEHLELLEGHRRETEAEGRGALLALVKAKAEPAGMWWGLDGCEGRQEMCGDGPGTGGSQPKTGGSEPEMGGFGPEMAGGAKNG